MKQIILAILISFSLAVLTAQSGTHAYRQKPPIVQKIGILPEYGRRRPLKHHFNPDLSARLSATQYR